MPMLEHLFFSISLFNKKVVEYMVVLILTSNRYLIFIWYIRGRVILDQQLQCIRQSWKIIVIQDCWFFLTITQLKRYVYSSPNISLVSNPSIVLLTLWLQFSFSLFPGWLSKHLLRSGLVYHHPSTFYTIFQSYLGDFFSEIDICLTSPYKYDMFLVTCHIRNL